MRVGVIAVCLAGCGRLAFDPLADRNGDGGNGDGAGDSPIATNCTTETFSSTPQPPWVMDSDNASCNSAFTTGQLVINLGPNVNCYARGRITGIDFTDATLTVEATQVVFGLQDESYLELHLDQANKHVITYSGGEIMFIRRLNNVNDVTSSAAYNVSTDRWWRMTHSSSRGEVDFFTSQDGTTWTQRFTASTGFGITNVAIEAGAGTYNGGDPAPGSPTFDNFTYCLR